MTPFAPPESRLLPVGQTRIARGESQLWLAAGALVLCLLMIGGLLVLVAAEGLSTFWPPPLVGVRLLDGRSLLGEPVRTEECGAEQALAGVPAAAQPAVERALADAGGRSTRQLLRTGNFELTNEHYTWVAAPVIAERSAPEWAVVVETATKGRCYGTPAAWRVDGDALATAPGDVLARFTAEQPELARRCAEADRLRSVDIVAINEEVEDARLAVRRAELRHGTGSPEHLTAQKAHAATARRSDVAAAGITDRIRALAAENAHYQFVLRTADGKDLAIPGADVVRVVPANRLSSWGRLGVYLDRWYEFLTTEPRANSEGGVWPAIVGTVLMTLLMTLCVVPFGVLAALWLREYARAGVWISAVRIAINNLAGVPSIVFGVFGLGFFCYLIGGSLDALFWPERLPSPTFGKGALVWASLTLALLTLPVVVVATEEALAAVPSSMREGSYACGAGKWQTIRRIVLPRALPGVMTGAILAMARGAGEVAPLMLVGAVRSAKDLPIDWSTPFLHPSRSFMHLGFHVYDVGFQSQNSEASKPVVFTTTLLLIAIVFTLNLVAVRLRSRLRTRFAGAQF
jgi:phosphate transport system permease protein